MREYAISIEMSNLKSIMTNFVSNIFELYKTQVDQPLVIYNDLSIYNVMSFINCEIH